ncbi:MAG TPA: class I SAM-dependent methyltransferase [Actinobacteria bacterium]|nr:class I SAM-dependent methyltransferase [Actinomycetota bacterium]
MMKLEILKQQTEQTRAVYNHRARTFSRTDSLDRRLTGRLRRRLWARIEDAFKILEIGVGAGANLDYYPTGAQITAVDISELMIELAKKKADRLNLYGIDFKVMDAQNLDFPDSYFDANQL